MCEKFGFCLFLVCLQCGIENRLKVGGGGRRGGVSLGHDSC